jgi:hypothetical protein
MPGFLDANAFTHYIQMVWAEGRNPMADKFISLLDKLGSLFKLGAEKALAFQANPDVQKLEADAIAVAQLAYPPAAIALKDVLAAIVKVEQIAVALKAPSGSGDAKLALVVPDVETLIFSEPLFAGKAPKNPALFNQGVMDMVKGLTEITNSFEATA